MVHGLHLSLPWQTAAHGTGESHQILRVALATTKGAPREPLHLQTDVGGPFEDSKQCSAVILRCGHDATFWQSRSTHFELGFDEQQRLSPRGEHRGDGVKDEAKGDEAEIAHHDVDRSIKVVCGESPSGRAASILDPWVGDEFSGKLVVPDIERDDLGRPVGEEHLGEAAGAGAEVEASSALRIDLGEGLERTDQFARGPTDPLSIIAGHADLLTGFDR